MTTEYTEADAVAALAQQAAEPTPLEPGQIYARLRDGEIVIDDTDDYATKPRKVSREAKAADAGSFLAYLDRRHAESRDGLEVWADLDNLTVIAVLDGHDGWRQDRLTLALRRSPEWIAWTERSGKLSSQLAFADFIEDQLSVIADPDGATLLEIVQSMQGSTKVQWQSADWLDNGARAFQWVEEVEAKAGRKGKLEIPSRFTLGLRPFVGSEAFKVVANLRYRIQDGVLSVGFKLPELDRVVEQAFADVVAQIDAGLTVPIFNGRG